MKKGWNKKGDSNLNTECPIAAILFFSQFLIIVHLLTTKKLENAATFLPAKINIPLSHCQDVFDGEEHYCPSPGCCERSE